MGIGGQSRSPALAQNQCQGAEVVPAVAEGQDSRYGARQGFGGTGQAQVLRPPGSPLRGGGEQLPNAIGSMKHSPALAQHQCQGAEVVPAVAEGQGFRHTDRQGFGGTGQAQVLRSPGSSLRGSGEQFPDAIGSMGWGAHRRWPSTSARVQRSSQRSLRGRASGTVLARASAARVRRRFSTRQAAPSGAAVSSSPTPSAVRGA